MSLSRLQNYQIHLRKTLGLDLENCLSLLEQHIHPVSRKHNELILQLSRFNAARREKRQGLLSNDQSTLVFNQIRAAVMSFIDDLEEGDINWDAIQEKDFVSTHVNNYAASSTMSDTEREGLTRQRKLIEEKLYFLQEQLLLAVAADAKFAISKQIEELDQQLERIKAKLAT